MDNMVSFRNGDGLHDLLVVSLLLLLFCVIVTLGSLLHLVFARLFLFLFIKNYIIDAMHDDEC